VSRPQRISIWSIQNRARRGTTRPWVARWSIDRRGRSRSFTHKREAEDFVARLRVAKLEGVRFSTETGEPVTWGQATADLTAAAWVKRWFDEQSSSMKPSSRTSLAEAMARILPHLVRSRAPEAPEGIRSAIQDWLAGKTEQPQFLSRWSIPLSDLTPERGRVAFDAACRRVSRKTTKEAGASVGANTIRRYRAAMRQIMGAAVVAGLLDEQPIPAAPKGNRRVAQKSVSEEVDVDLLPTVREAADCIERMRNRRPVSNSYATVAYVILLAGLRPSEARALLIEQVELPDQGFGQIRVLRSAQDPGLFTQPGEEVGPTKTGVIRSVPIPPQLVRILRAQIGERTSGIVAPSETGGTILLSNLDRSWARARTNSSWVPYSLRHTAATGWLRSGVSLTETARRLGHSTEMLIKVYAGLFRDDVDRANACIATWLDDEWIDADSRP
jgi:integrase